jgi:hypothetical protein
LKGVLKGVVAAARLDTPATPVMEQVVPLVDTFASA